MTSTDVHDIRALTRTGPIPVQPPTASGRDGDREPRPRPSGTGGDADR